MPEIFARNSKNARKTAEHHYALVKRRRDLRHVASGVIMTKWCVQSQAATAATTPTDRQWQMNLLQISNVFWSFLRKCSEAVETLNELLHATQTLPPGGLTYEPDAS